jgi:hypothetical protein
MNHLNLSTTSNFKNSLSSFRDNSLDAILNKDFVKITKSIASI